MKHALVLFAVLLGLTLAAPRAHADTVDTFTLSNATLINWNTGKADGSLSGTVSIDITNGTYYSSDITWNKVSGAFSVISDPRAIESDDYAVDLQNGTDTIGFFLSAPGTLVNYGGGSICSGAASCSHLVSSISNTSTGDYIAEVTAGSLTYSSSFQVGTTPELSSLLLLGTGPLGMIGAARRRFRG